MIGAGEIPKRAPRLRLPHDRCATTGPQARSARDDTVLVCGSFSAQAGAAKSKDPAEKQPQVLRLRCSRQARAASLRMINPEWRRRVRARTLRLRSGQAVARQPARRRRYKDRGRPLCTQTARAPAMRTPLKFGRGLRATHGKKLSVGPRVYLLPPWTPSFSSSAACAAAKRAVSRRNGEQET